MKIVFKPVFFDSLGAKSSCTFIQTSDIRILIDPGIAIMHSSYPAPLELKRRWVEEGKSLIKNFARNVDIIVVTHYHYDHFMHDIEIYRGKKVFIKNPNEYINDSQRNRAIKFFQYICNIYGYKLEDLMENPIEKDYPDPLKDIPIASGKDFGEYNDRRRELLEKGYKWFYKRVEKWIKYRRIPELKTNDIEFYFAENRSFRFGETVLRFSKPFFHGIEFSRVGWVYSVIVKYRGYKLLYTSDLNGPIIEDYAEWIIKENPDILILDGPMTYMLGYTLNLINFERTIKNALNIVKNIRGKTIIYDHHLPREPKFRERTKIIWETGKRLGKSVVTAAEYLGKTPVIFTINK